MTDLIDTLRAIIRDELSRHRSPELAIVTEVSPRTGDDSEGNHQVHARLRQSGVELQHVPVAVGRLGLSLLPQVGDLVLIAFVGGDANAPVVVGSLYDDSHHPPVAEAPEAVYLPPDDSESGIRRLHLELPSGTTITVDDDNVLIESGGTQITVARAGDVTIKSPGKIALECDGDMALKASGNLDLEAAASITLKGASATLEGSGSTTVKGPSLTLAGNTQFSPS